MRIDKDKEVTHPTFLTNLSAEFQDNVSQFDISLVDFSLHSKNSVTCYEFIISFDVGGKEWDCCSSDFAKVVVGLVDHV